jgi:hypothetical protein
MGCGFPKAKTSVNITAAFRRAGIVPRLDGHAGLFNASLIAAKSQKSGTGVNPRRGFTSSSFQRLIENEETKQQVLSFSHCKCGPDHKESPV